MADQPTYQPGPKPERVRITVEFLEDPSKSQKSWEFDQVVITEELDWEPAPESVLDDPMKSPPFITTGNHTLSIQASLSRKERAEVAEKLNNPPVAEPER